MKHLKIENFGPLKSADLDFGRINLIIGLQGSGKSCVMMTACYCDWVEKRISLRQSAIDFEVGSNFIDIMLSYYRAKGYLHKDTYIEYKTEFMCFSYDHKKRSFSHQWESLRWEYRRPKVSYVPAERNMVSLVSNWNRLETNYDSILDFKADWDTARRYVKNIKDILSTGISYEYDESTGMDTVITSNGNRLGLTSSSSGMQSLIPQIVHLSYLSDGIYDEEEQSKTFAEKKFALNLLDILYERINGTATAENASGQLVVHIEGRDFLFKDNKLAEQFRKQAGNFRQTDHTDVFLEEPESNLFPPTQFQLMDWITEMATDKVHKNTFVIATHSPYVLSHLLQEDLKDFKLFFTHPDDGGYFSVKTATEADIQDIYDNGSDAFFNFESFVADETV